MFANTNVQTLSIADFDDKGNIINPKYKGKSLVLFFASWCPHCVHTKPVYMELANNKKANYLAFDMSSPDEMTKSKMSNWKFKVQGYPTIVSFYNGQPYSTYQGDRTVQDLTMYVNNIGKNWQI